MDYILKLSAICYLNFYMLGDFEKPILISSPSNKMYCTLFMLFNKNCVCTCMLVITLPNAVVGSPLDLYASK